MHALAAILLLASGAVLEVGLAPDQPLPFVYIDDPLIIEIRSDVDANALVRVEVVSAATGERVEREIADVPLRAGGARWLDFPDLPRERGYYEVVVRVAAGDVTTTDRAGFCRIDRPLVARPEDRAGAAPPLPIIARHVTGDRRVLLALLGIGVRTIQIDRADGSGAEHPCAEAEHLGFRMVAEASLAGGKEDVDNALALHAACPDATAWVLYGTAAPQRVFETAQRLREAGVTAPVLGAATSLASGIALIETDEARVLRGISAPSEDFAAIMPALREIAEARGYEAWHFQAAQTGTPRLDDDAAIRLLRDAFRAFAAGASALVFDDAWIYDGATGPWMAYCGALSRRMTVHRYAGEINLGNGETAALFRNGAAWFLPLWTEGAEREVRLPLEGAQNLVWTDALNNPLEAPSAERPSVTIAQRPRYLTGEGGELLTKAALHQISKIATAFDKSARYQHYLPETLTNLIAALGENPESSNARNRFFQLIRYLPELENQWHTGTLPRTIAAPAIAHLARLARPLCVVEEARTQPFLEPLHDTLLNCEEYQSLYLTGSVGTSLASERGDWLLREVQRLAEEARLLAAQGRPIEAGAVATLAEWRARALEFAAKAGPLSDAAQELPIGEPLLTDADTSEESEDRPDSTELPEETTPEPVVVAAEENSTRPVPPQEAGSDGAREADQPAGTRKLTHTVRSGDTPGGIARKYGVALADFLRWNGLRSNSVIRIGDTYTVYAPADNASAAPVAAPAAAPVAAPAAEAAPTLEVGQPPGTRKVVHVVKRGDNPDAIARRYGVSLADLQKWNKLQRNSVIHIGDEFVVYVPAERR